MLRMVVAGLDDGDNNRTAAFAGVKAAYLTRLQGVGRDTVELAQLINEHEPVAALIKRRSDKFGRVLAPHTAT
ncbi:hypothetical protein [Lentzea nigeriaca]|uniref:hypothetical protein n=1 Tax=Lentzea nigeriaca TaxID=1128665 RepID=UPI001956A8C7|nr:hypothetical protein [Lentzea nigeriaca]MBM7863647.1 hypothetical protein [Lentzea nigeriaca]